MEHPQGYVEIATIASFNRMTQLCSDLVLVVKAMKMCPSVEVIDDQWVKPTRPLPEPKNVDSVTIYVEKLPPHADHDWIKSVFSSCGKVVYVSLPRYKSNRAIKGFAFVEFEKESEAEQALEMFDQRRKNEKDDDEQEGERNEENVDQATEKQERKNRKRKRKSGDLENEEGKIKERKLKHKKKEDTNEVTSDSSGTFERQLEERQDEKDEEGRRSGRKKRKSRTDKELSDGNDHSIELEKNGEIKNKLNEREDEPITTGVKRKRESCDDSDDDSTLNRKAKELREDGSKDAELEESRKGKHKKRKRKKKEKKEIGLPNLRVMSKLEWLRLKQEYQKLQREAMKEVKMNLKKSQSPPPIRTEKTSKKAPDLSRNNASVEGTGLADGGMELPTKLEMQRGVVLKYFAEKNIDKKNLRDAFSAFAPVSYLEMSDDKEMGFVRFRTKQGCQKVVEAVKNGLLETVRVEELNEKEDEEYWEKLNHDRTERFQQKKNRKKRRGILKITEKLEAQAKKRDHIHFDE